MLPVEIEELKAEVERLGRVDVLCMELLEHERDTHKVLGAILGTDDSLEVLARRLVERNKELEDRIKKLEYLAVPNVRISIV